MKDFRFTEEWRDLGDYQIFVVRGNYKGYFFTTNTVIPEALIINEENNEQGIGLDGN